MSKTSPRNPARGATAPADAPDHTARGASNFIRDIIDADLASGKHTGIVTRFPPEPNGFLHIGHAKSICLNFGLAEDYGGACNLRFDDTNPANERVDYVRAIQRDVEWLGFRWAGEVRFASDYFERMYACAEELVTKGLAYVESLSQDEIRELRGTPYEPGKNSPDRERPVAENLDLLRRMRAGEFPDGAYVLRAKIDMASPNIIMRDPALYRIKRATHHRTGDDWCIYPMYDFAHCIEDAIEHVTHSICTLEFENNRELYDWVIENVSVPGRPRQYEFARLNLDYTVMSKRKLLQLVEDGHVSGWDDPRLPTLSGLRRRGVTSEAVRAFCAMVGVAKTNSVVDIGKLEFCIRDDLNARAPRVMAVLRPLRVVITNYPEGQTEELDASYWPEDIDKQGTRKVPFGRELLIEREDFLEDPPKKWYRLAPGREVRLRYGYFITCDEVIKDSAGEVVELRCSYDPQTAGGNAPDGRKVKGTIHWVSAAASLPCEVRLYDRLFLDPRPGSDDRELPELLNPESLTVLHDSRIEPSVQADPSDTRYQFERTGYFWRDPEDSAGERLVFNRIVGLRDSWAKTTAASGAQSGAARGKPAAKGKSDAKDKAAPKATGERRQQSDAAPRESDRDKARAADPSLAARFERYIDGLGVSRNEADVLTGEGALGDYFETALGVHDAPRSVSKWIVNELLGAAKDVPLAELPFDAARFAALVALVDDGTVSTPAAKEVLAEMIDKGGDPATIVEARGLTRVSDTGALETAIDEILARHADAVTRYKGGETKLLGLFMGELMKATRGAADPKTAKDLLLSKLG